MTLFLPFIPGYDFELYTVKGFDVISLMIWLLKLSMNKKKKVIYGH